MDPSELKKLEPTLKIIENYIAGNTIPRGNKSPQKLQRWLQDTIRELEEYDVYKTAGPYQRQVEEYLKRCRKLLSPLKNVIQWYEDLPRNSQQREWQMEFHRIGTSKYPGSKKILDGDDKMKIVKVKKTKKGDTWNPSMGKLTSRKVFFDKDNIRLEKRIFENGEAYEFSIYHDGITSGDEEQAKETLQVLRKMTAALEQALRLAK